MVDFEGSKRGGFERDMSADEALGTNSNDFQDAPVSASAGTRILAADVNGVVTLPAGVALDNFVIEGYDLVIIMDDGTRLVIPDGAVNTPQIVIDGVAVPPLNISALLNGTLTPAGDGTTPPQLPSSGGDFDDGESSLQDAFDLGDLLPYTELPLAVEEEEEIIPFENEEPEVVIETPDNPVGVENAIATVAERGLPERGDPAEPEGTADETDAETTSGTIVFNSPDGIGSIVLNGVEITSVGQEFVTPFGTLTITSIDLDAGEIGFSYTLADNLLGTTEDGNFFVTVTDLDGDSADATLSIIVEDDSPIAAADIGIVPAGSHDPILGNVLDNDESGADDYPEGEEGPDAVTGFSSVETGAEGAPGDSIQGEYGVLTLNADGSYTYVRDFNTPGGVEEVFNYTIIDQDGSTSTTTLTIEIENAIDTVEVPTIGEGTTVNEGGLPPRGDEPVGTGEGADGDPDDNSDPSESTGSTISFNSPDGVASITIDGVEVNLDNEAGNDADDQVIVDDETGTLVITAVTYDPVTGDGTITYEYTLGDNTVGDQDVDGGNTTVPFDVVVTDLDGDVADDTLVITVVDDAPTIEANGEEPALEVDESDFDTNDTQDFSGAFDITPGADGVGSVEYTLGTTAAASGLVDTLSGEAVILSVTLEGVVEGRTETGDELVFTVSVDGDGNVTLDQSRAVVHADDTDPDDPVALADELVTLTATVTDGDGDVDDATIGIGDSLTFRDDGPAVDATVTDGDTVVLNTQDAETRGADTDTASSTANFSGAFSVGSSDFGADGAGSIAWDYSLDVVNGDSGLSSDGDPITLSLVGGVVEGRTSGDVLVFDISVDAATGVVTLNQYAELDHPLPGDDSNYDAQELVLDTGLVNLVGEATITDGDGDTASDTETLDLGGNVVFDDDGPAIDAAVSDGDEVVLNTQDAETRGADTDTDTSMANFSGSFSIASSDFGADGAGTTEWAFSLDVVDGDSGLSSDGDPITLSLVGGVVEGRTSGGVLVFDISVDAATGVVTLNQYEELDHPLPGDDSNYDAQELALGTGLVNLVGEATITDGDGDTASDTEVLDLGGNIVFDDDGPSVNVTEDEADLEVDETDFDTDDTQDFSGAFDVDFGADGAGTVDYTLGVVAGPSGLTDTLSGEAVILSVTPEGVVEGRTETGDELVFTVSVDGDGNVTLDQSRAVEHPDSDDHDDPISLADELVTLTATATDGDGDTAENTIDIGENLTFRDDGPAIDAAVTDGDTVVLNTQDAETRGDDTDTDTSMANFSGAFSVGSSDFGADGAGSIVWDFSLDITAVDGATTLTSDGDAITLFQLMDGTVVGSTATDINDVDDTNTVFDISVDAATGVVTLNQYAELDHPLPGDDSNYDQQGLPLPTGLVNLVGEATITDGDGDTASDTETLDLGGNIVFDDDGPSVTADGPEEQLVVDETNIGVDDTKDFSGAFTIDYGADGAGMVAYSLGITSADSGLIDTVSGQDVVLTVEGGDVVGRTETGGDEVFRVSVDGDGNVTLDQSRAVVHSDPSSDNEPVSLVDGLVTLTATATDGDGDTAEDSIDIGANLTFLDDGPNFEMSVNLEIDEDALAEGNDDAAPGDDAGSSSVTGNFIVDFGEDGPNADELTVSVDSVYMRDPDGGVITLTSGGDTVLFDWDAATNTLTGYTSDLNDPVLTVTFDLVGDSYTFTLFKPVDHPATDDGSNTLAGYEDNLGLFFDVTVTDGDNDTATIDGSDFTQIFEGFVVIDDDMAIANADVASQTTENQAFTIDALDNDDFGADGVDTSDATKVFVSTDATQGTVTYDPGTGLFTYTPDAGAGSDSTADFFEYTIIDGDGDASTARVNITLQPDSEPEVVDVVAAVDDDGFDDGNPADGGGDIDATVGSDPASASELVFNGSIDVDFGNDGGTVTFANLHGTQGQVGTETVDYTWDESTDTLTATGPRGVLFTVSLTPDGDYTVTLEDNVLHAAGGGEASAPAVVLNYLAKDSDDGDEDATGALTITFNDDAPTVEQNADPIGTAVLDESPADEDEGGDFDPAGLASVTLDLGDNFTEDFGADGEAASDSTTYALVLDGEPVASGLYALDAADADDVGDDGDGIGQGDQIMLTMDGDDVVGMAGGTEYFRISVDEDGVVTFTQSNNIWHGNTGSDDDTASLIAAAGAFVLEATVTDGDGDTDTAEIDLGGSVFQIEDDGPTTSANDFVQLDDDDLTGGNDGGDGDVDSSVVLTGTLGHDFGTDGAGSIDFASMDGDTVDVGGVTVTYSWDAGTNTLTANDGDNDVFSVEVNPATGAYEVTQLGVLDHHTDANADDFESNPEFVLTYTVTDADGDSQTGTFTVKVNDDTPEATNDSFDQQAEDAPVNGFVGTNDSPGADGLGSYVYNGDIANGQNAATGMLNFNGATGEFTYTPGAGETGTVTFSYTLVDGDGDEVTATVAVNLLGDSTPTLGDEDLTVWEEGLPARTGESEGSNEPANNETASGDFTITTGNDTLAVLEIQDTNGVWIDVTAATELSPITVDGANGTLTVTSDGAGNYSYSYTLEDNLENHPDNDPVGVDGDGIDGVDDPLLGESFAVRVEDSDGDEATETLTVTVLDDAPTANDDGSVIFPIAIAEDTATVINVIANDVQGADSVDLVNDVVKASDPANGSVSYNDDGTFTYTPNAGYAGPDSFTYTITDGDGDPSTATVYVNVAADSEPSFDAGNATVDEDGLLGANVDANPLQTGPDETDSTELASQTVNFTVNYGNDTPADVDAAIVFINPDSLDGQLTSNGEMVNFELVGGDLVGTINGGATTVMTIALNAGTDNMDGTVSYSYTVTLSEPVEHTDPNSEDTELLTGVTIQVTDSDMSTSTDTFSVTVVDDVLTAVNDGNISTQDDNASGVTIGTVATLTGNDVFGADGEGSPVITNISAGSLGGSVTIDGMGNLIYTSGFDITSPYANAVETFTYTVVDGDGDVDTATFTVTLTDTGPTAGTSTALVDDDGLGTDGNGPESAGDDLDANTDSNNDDTVFVGTLSGSFGVDSAGGSFSFAAMNGVVDTSGAEDITYSWDGGTNKLTASSARGEVFNIVVDPATGAYTVTLVQNFLHDGGDDGELAGGVDTLGLTYTVADGEGETAVGFLNIRFGDDAPLAFTPDSGFIDDVTDPMTPTTITEDLNLLIGADTPAQLSFAASLNGTAVIDGNTGAPVTVGTDALTYYIAPNGDLVATTGTAHDDGVEGFRFVLDPGTSEYTLTISQNLSNGTTTSFTDLTSSAAGNLLFRTIGEDAGDPAAVDVLLSADDNGTQVTVNTDSDSIGAANQSVSAGQTIRIDFLNGITTDGGNVDTGLAWTGQEDTTSFQQDIPQVQGNQSQTAGIDVYALDSTLASGQAPDTDPTDGFGGDSVVITEVTVTKFNDPTPDTPTVTFDLTGFVDGQSTSSGGITVTFNDNGSETWVTIGGLQQGDSYSIDTGANTFNGVAVTVLDDAGQPWTQDDLDLGIFSIGTFSAGDDIELSVGVVATDEDGDTATGTIDVTIDQDGSGPPMVPPVVLDIQGDGNVFVGLDAGVAYDYNGDGQKTQTAWIAAGAAILAYDANANGMIDGASEFVFGDANTTDLEALLANFDSNGNATLDAGDAEYGKFGVWMDDGDGVYEAGEFKSLDEVGIASIDLELNGIGGEEVGGDVVVYNTVSYTNDDGSTGTAYDAAFALGGDALDASASVMDALLTMGSENAPTDSDSANAAEEGVRKLPDAEAIVKDVLAETVVDAMLNAISGDEAEPVHTASPMTSDVLMKTIDTGAFAFDSGVGADMTEEAAALATMNA